MPLVGPRKTCLPIKQVLEGYLREVGRQQCPREGRPCSDWTPIFAAQDALGKPRFCLPKCH